MKIVIFIILAFSYITFSQNRLDPQPILDSLTVNDSIFSTTENKFIKAWNWSSQSRKLDSALDIDYNHTFINPQLLENTGMYSNNTKFILAVPKNASSKPDNSILNAQAMHYEVTFKPSKSKFPIFNPDDSLNSTYGFDFINDSIFNITQDIEHNLKLNKILMNNLNVNSLEILKDPFPNDKLFYIGNFSTELKEDGIQSDAPFGLKNGTKWYLTIKLRALETINIGSTNDTVLAITMPYKAIMWNGLTFDTTYSLIDFSQFPRMDFNPGNIDTMVTDRGEFIGYARALDINSVMNDTFYVTGRMLQRWYPTYMNQEYITLSAFFKCDSTKEVPWGINPELQNHEPPFTVTKDSNTRITNLGINVVYYKSIDVAIDWIRIETPQFRKLIRGEFDREIIQNVNNELINIQALRPNLKVEKIYGMDEFLESWAQAHRYYNKLLGGKVISEFNDHSTNASHILNLTGFDYYWNGAGINVDGTMASSPLVRRTFKKYTNYKDKMDIRNRLGYLFGYFGKEHWELDSVLIAVDRMKYLTDTLRSGYESWIDIYGKVADSLYYPMLPDSIIYNIVKNTNYYEMEYQDVATDTNYIYYSTLSNFGVHYYDAYFNRPDLIYNEKPLMANIWISSNAMTKSKSVDTTFFQYKTKPQTPEELRLQIWGSLILGTKGLIYYHGATGIKKNEAQDTTIYTLGLMRINQWTQFPNQSFHNDSIPTGDSLIYGDIVGGDWFNYNEICSWDNKKIRDFINDTIRFDSLNINADRVYIGTASNRVELMKTNNWINHNEDTLMKLKLQAWYWKDYKEYYSQNAYSISPNVDILSHYIRYKNIRTRRIFEPNANLVHNYTPDFENRDSSFFDITLFSYGQDTLNSSFSLTKKEFYLGVLNRRTDPLIFNYNVSGTDTVSQMSFYSQVEWDTFMRDSVSHNDLLGIARDSTWWKEQYWKRLGIREISIPFQRLAYGNGKYVIVNELGASNLDTLGWYYGEDYYDMINERFSNVGDTIKLVLFPGQGKILKVKYKPYYIIDSELADTCELCETVNDFEKMTLDVAQIDTTREDGKCCYKFTLNNNTDCFYNNFPYRVIVSSGISGAVGVEFNGTTGTDTLISGPLSKYKQYYNNIDSNSSLEAFELCLPAGRKYTIDLILGTDTMGVFSACNRNFKTQIECDSLPKDCCEGIENLFSVVESHEEVIPEFDTLTPQCGNNVPIMKCVNKIKIDTSFSSDCFYSLAVDFIGNGRGMRTIKSGVGGNPIDFQSLTNGELPALEFYSCAICDSTLSYNVTKLPVYFLGRDGETICMDSIPIRLCCGNAKILDLNVSQGPKYKTSFETPSEDKFIEVNSTNIRASIKPNPSNGVFNLEFESYLNQDIEIKVVDLYGNIYYKIDKDKYNKGYYSKTINLGNMSNGSYFVNLSGDKSNITIPIIIMK